MKVDGSRFLYTAGGRSAYLPDGREATVVVTTDDGSIGVLADQDRWYVVTLHTVAGRTAATVLKVHGGKPYAYRDAERLAASRRDMPAAAAPPQAGPSAELKAFGVPNNPPPQTATSRKASAIDAATAGVLAKRLANVRSTTKKQDQRIASKAPFIVVGVIVLALVTPPIMLIAWVPIVIFLMLAWLGARSDS